MPRLILIAAFSIAVLLFSTLPAFAGARLADNPKYLTGKIKECPDGSIEIKSASGTIKIPVIKHSPDHLYRFGELFEDQGDDTNAEKYYRKCLAADPDHHKAKVKLGFAEETEEEKKEAEKKGEDKQKLDKNDRKNDPDLDFSKYKDEAVQHYRAARADYKRAGKVAKNKNSSRLDILDLMSKSAAGYEKALKIEPNFHEARRELCIVCKVIGASRRSKVGANALKKGLKHAEKYIKSHKKDTEMMHLAAWFARMQSKISKAESLLKKALKVKPNDPALVQALCACYLAARMLPGAKYGVDKKKAGKAVKLVEEALKEHENHRALLLLLAKAQISADKLDEAKVSYEKILNGNPNDVDANCGLGRLLHLQAKPDEALTYLKKALAKDPNHHDAISYIILVYEGKRDYENEKIWLKKYLSVHPKGQNAKLYKSMLKKVEKKLKGKKK
jgi:tetratricopeptide (TPR) repeat protein